MPSIFSFCFRAQALQMHLCPHASKIQVAFPSRQTAHDPTSPSSLSSPMAAVALERPADASTPPEELAISALCSKVLRRRLKTAGWSLEQTPSPRVMAALDPPDAEVEEVPTDRTGSEIHDT